MPKHHNGIARHLLPLFITAALAAQTASAATYNADFNSGAVPAGMTLTEPSKVVAAGGVGGTGYLSLTDAIGSQNGGAAIDDFNGGQAVGGFKATMKLLIGGGSSQPADGFSFSFGDDISGGAIGEEGSGTGFVLSLDTYDNGGGEAPAMDVRWGGVEIAHTKWDGVTSLTIPPLIDPATGKPASLQTGTEFVDLVIDLHPNGTLDVVYKGIPVFANLFIPGYTPKAGRFALGGRTGGATENHWVDNLSITTVAPISGPPTILVQPASQTIDERKPVTFSVIPNGAPGFTFQWSKNGTAIPDATGNTYTIASTSFNDNGTKYKVRVTNGSGSVDSAEATLTVNADTVKPAISSAAGSDVFTQVTVVFSEPVTQSSAEASSNYKIDGGINVTGARLANPTTVTLTTSRQTAGKPYVLTVSNVRDTAAAGNAVEANSTKNFVAFDLTKGGVKFEAFLNIPGGIQALLEDPKYQENTPDVTAYTTQFTSRLVFTDSANENYGGRISGWITPAKTAQYEFFVRSDDASQLYLSTDDNPQNAVMIAEETGCCGPFEEPGAVETSAPTPLTAGKRYYIYVIWKEGGGGDYCDVAWREVGDPAVPRALPYIQGNILETYASPGTFEPPTISFASPASGAIFDSGAPITITPTVEAKSGKTVAKVDYYELGKKIGESTASPFAITLSGVPDGLHGYTARATDSAGIYTDSAKLEVTVGRPVEQLDLVKIDTNTKWRYDRSGEDLGTAWRELTFNDNAWPQGPALIADEGTTTVETIRTAISRFNDAGVYVKTFYYRTKFNFPYDASPAVKLALRHVVDDGAVFYLNGVEIHRFGIPAGVVVDATTDAGGHENAYEGPYDIPAGLLKKGENVLAAEVHQAGGSSSDMVFGAELVATVSLVPKNFDLLKIDANTKWRYDRSGEDLGTAWREKNFNDSAWPQGPALIADEGTTTVEPIRTAISRLNDAGVYVKTFYFRSLFNIPITSTKGAKLALRHVVDDGAVIYLNGTEIHRFGIAATVVVDATTDAGGHENTYEGPYDIPITALLPGDNVVAVEVHQAGGSSSDMVFGLELVASVLVPGGGEVPPPKVSIALAGASVNITWTNGGKLYSTDRVGGTWTEVPGSGSATVPVGPGTKLFRVVR